MDADPLIDEVRAIRREVSAEFGNDAERLCAHLREVEQEFLASTGRFAGLRKLSPEEVARGWQSDLTDEDPFIDERRAARRAGSQPQP